MPSPIYILHYLQNHNIHNPSRQYSGNIGEKNNGVAV